MAKFDEHGDDDEQTEFMNGALVSSTSQVGIV